MECSSQPVLGCRPGKPVLLSVLDLANMAKAKKATQSRFIRFREYIGLFGLFKWALHPKDMDELSMLLPDPHNSGALLRHRYIEILPIQPSHSGLSDLRQIQRTTSVLSWDIDLPELKKQRMCLQFQV